MNDVQPCQLVALLRSTTMDNGQWTMDARSNKLRGASKVEQRYTRGWDEKICLLKPRTTEGPRTREARTREGILYYV